MDTEATRKEQSNQLTLEETILSKENDQIEVENINMLEKNDVSEKKFSGLENDHTNEELSTKKTISIETNKLLIEETTPTETEQLFVEKATSTATEEILIEKLTSAETIAVHSNSNGEKVISEENKAPSDDTAIAEAKENDTENNEDSALDNSKKQEAASTDNEDSTSLVTEQVNANEEITEETVKDKVRTLQDLMKRVRKNFGILPALQKKRKASDCKSIDEPHTKKARTDVDKELPLIQDREKLMDRLKTYSNIYHQKSRPLTALECAEHGWSYTRMTVEHGSSVAVLQCSNCNNNLFVADLNLQHCTEAQAEKIRTKYNEGLFIWHNDDCIWKKKSCPNNIYNIPITPLSKRIDRIKCEGRNMSSYQTIPLIQNRPNEVILKRIRSIISDAEGLSQEEVNDSKINAYLLPLFGWQFIDIQTPGIVCNLCFARKIFDNDQKTINAISEHYTYCPWKNSEITQKNGFNLMIQAVYKEYELLVRRRHISYRNRNQQDEEGEKIMKDILQSRKSLLERASIDSVEKST